MSDIDGLPGPSVIQSHPHVTKSHTLTWVRGDNTGHSSLCPSTKLATFRRIDPWMRDHVPKTWWHMEDRLQRCWMFKVCCCAYKADCLFAKKKKFLGHSLMSPEWRGRAAHPPALVGDNATALLVTQGATPSFCYFDAWQMFTVSKF